MNFLVLNYSVILAEVIVCAAVAALNNPTYPNVALVSA